MNIASVLQLENKMIVPKVSGVIEYVGELKSGKGAFGDWTLQSIKIKDETGEIYCNLGNQRRFAIADKGTEITITANDSEKHGLTGIVVNDYKGAKQLKVSKSALITTDGEAALKEKPTTETKPDAPAPEASVQAPPKINKNQTPEYWDNKQSKDNRRTIWDSVFMTTYPALVKEGKTAEEILDIVDLCAKRGNMFVEGLPADDTQAPPIEAYKEDAEPEKDPAEDIEIPF